MSKRSDGVLSGIMIAMLCIAMLPLHTYGYYVLLKFVICGGCGYLATQAFSSNRMGWVWLLGMTAVVYNPFFRFALGRLLWTLINIATIVELVLVLLAHKRR